MSGLPLLWRAQRLADQVATTMRVLLPDQAWPRRIGMFRLRRKVDDLRARGRSGLVPIDVEGYEHPVWVRGGTSDLDVLAQLMVHHELGFDMPVPPQWIIDIGANIGLSAVYFARRFPGARILAVEVEAENFEVLMRNSAPYPQITPIHKAVWCEGGRVRITNPDAQPWSFRVESTRPDDPDGIEAVSINDLVAQFSIPRIDLLKMDIEGSEREVLSDGLHPWIGRTGVLAVELHERHRQGCEAALLAAIGGQQHQRDSLGEYHVIRFVQA